MRNKNIRTSYLLQCLCRGWIMRCLSLRRLGTSSVWNRFDSATSLFSSLAVLRGLCPCNTDKFCWIHVCKLLDKSRYSWNFRCVSYRKEETKTDATKLLQVMVHNRMRIYWIIERMKSRWFRKHVVQRRNVRNQGLLIRFGGVNVCNCPSTSSSSQLKRHQIITFRI